MMRKTSIYKIFLLFVFVFFFSYTSYADYLKIDPPPDVDKKDHHSGKVYTCWLATASNMLAGAGYTLAGDIDETAGVDYNDVRIMHNYWLDDCGDE